MHAEVLGRVKRRERWTQQQRLRMVEETFLPANSASRTVHVHDTAPNHLFGTLLVLRKTFISYHIPKVQIFLWLQRRLQCHPIPCRFSDVSFSLRGGGLPVQHNENSMIGFYSRASRTLPHPGLMLSREY